MSKAYWHFLGLGTGRKNIYVSFTNYCPAVMSYEPSGTEQELFRRFSVLKKREKHTQALHTHKLN